MSARGILQCRACDSKNLFIAISLGNSPLANRLLENKDSELPSYPLALRICSECSLGQLGEFQSPEEIFSDYPYLSSTSQTWLDSNQKFASELIKTMNFTNEDLVLEIASNDGYLLKFFQESGISVLGVEPAKNVAKIATDLGIPTIASFFGLQLAKELSERNFNPRLIVAKNVIAHVPDLQDFVSGLSALSSPETLLVIEAPTISQIMTEHQFDTIYHEHFSYVSALSLVKLFSRFGLEIFGAEKVDTHGGSVRFLAKKIGGHPYPSINQNQTLQKLLLSERSLGITEELAWTATREKINSVLIDAKEWLDIENPEITTVAYGAAAKGVTLLAAIEAGENAIHLVIDNSAGKIGKYFPISKSRILSEQDFIGQMSGGKYRYIIFPWNLIEELSLRIREFDPEAEIFSILSSNQKGM